MNHIKVQNMAFSSGSKLWIVADLESSKLAQKLDWYLNFQLRRSSLHKPKKISQATQEKIANWGVNLQDLTKSVKNLDREKSALLIASHKLLPNQLTVQIPFKDNSISDWVQRCIKVLRELKILQARIFLPSEISSGEFTKVANAKLNDGNFIFEIVEEGAND